MDPMTASMLISGGSNILGGMAAGNAQEAAANKAYDAQRKSLARMQEMLESIGIPSIEAQKLALEQPEYAGDLITENLGPSAMEEIQTDPRLQNAQMDALRDLQETGRVGMTPEERAQREELLRQSAAQNQSQQKSILQNMAERGNLDGGASLIAQLQSNTAQSSDARRQSEQMAADTAARRRDAIMRAANLSGSMEAQDFNRQSSIAGAKDRINQFNTQTSNRAQERNLDSRQQNTNQAANIANQQQQYNKQLQQQKYQNEMNRYGAASGIVAQQGQNAANRATQIGASQAGQASGMGASIGNAATAIGGYMSKG